MARTFRKKLTWETISSTFCPLEDLLGGKVLYSQNNGDGTVTFFCETESDDELLVEFVDDINHDLVPSRGSEQAAGYDLKAAEDGVIYGLERRLIASGIKLTIPEGYYGQIFGRSGLAVRHGIMAMAGVIDSDYRGEVKVLLHNSGNEPFFFSRGDRIAQMVILPHAAFPVRSGFVADTVRGTDGFGSTGQ